MKKKLFLIATAALLIGCSNAKDNDKDDDKIDEGKGTTYVDGIYEETVTGYGGDFTIKITIDEDRITEITATDNQETPSIGQAAITDLTSQMIDKQTSDVEVVSGATVTSNAFKEGVKTALERAAVSNDSDERQE